MQIVISLPEEAYDLITGKIDIANIDLYSMLIQAVKNGIHLPKVHGRILDEKDILDIENNDGGWYDLVDMPEYIAGVKAIVEAEGRMKNDENDMRYMRKRN